MAVEQEIITRFAALRSALVSDCLDKIGLRDNVLAPRIRPLAPGMRFAGRAVTVKIVATSRIPADPTLWYSGELQVVDALAPGDVLVTSTCPDGPFFGELLSTAARARGASGVVIDGASRDVAQIREMGFPVFVASINPLDSLGRLDVEAANVPIECGGVTVVPGDVVVGDDDGVVVVPAAVADQVAELAEEKASGEDAVREALAAGASVWETFQRLGVM